MKRGFVFPRTSEISFAIDKNGNVQNCASNINGINGVTEIGGRRCFHRVRPLYAPFMDADGNPIAKGVIVTMEIKHEDVPN